MDSSRILVFEGDNLLYKTSEIRVIALILSPTYNLSLLVIKNLFIPKAMWSNTSMPMIFPASTNLSVHRYLLVMELGFINS